MAFRKPAVIEAEIAALVEEKKAFLKLPVSGSEGSTSLNYGGRIAEIRQEIEDLEAELLASKSAESGMPPRRPQFRA